MTFSATDAAFEGFRVTRRHPGGVLAWAGVMLVSNFLSGWAIGAMAGPDWRAFEAQITAPNPDPAELAALTGRVAPAALISGGVQVLAAAIVVASILRTLLRPERRVTLGFGRDELRVLGLFLAFLGVSTLATVILGAVTGSAGQTFATLVGMAVTVLLFIRFSLAGPMTIADHRFHFRESWTATKGWFWVLLGSEALGAALCLVVAVLANMVFFFTAAAIMTAAGRSVTEMPSVLSPDFSSPEKLLAVGPLLYVAFLSVLYALVFVILIGPSVELYRYLNRDKAAAA